MTLLRGPAQYVLVGGEIIYNVHPQDNCAGRPCCVHNPSDHHMKDWPQHWREDRGIMERICSHGIGHPDIDQPLKNPWEGIHGCDSCCHLES